MLVGFWTWRETIDAIVASGGARERVAQQMKAWGGVDDDDYDDGDETSSEEEAEGGAGSGIRSGRMGSGSRSGTGHSGANKNEDDAPSGNGEGGGGGEAAEEESESPLTGSRAGAGSTRRSATNRMTGRSGRSGRSEPWGGVSALDPVRTPPMLTILTAATTVMIPTADAMHLLPTTYYLLHTT